MGKLLSISKTKLLDKLNIEKNTLNGVLNTLGKRVAQESFSPQEVNLIVSYLTSIKAIKKCSIKKNEYTVVNETIKPREDIAVLSKLKTIEHKTVKNNRGKMSCKTHQNHAVSDINKELLVNRRAQYISACGTGKTLVSQKVVEELVLELDNSVSLVLLPSLDLLAQFFRSWKSNTTIQSYLKPYILCSDDEIINGDGVDSKNTYASVIKNCFTEDIKTFFTKDDMKHKLIFSTYHSVHLLGDILEQLSISIDIAVFDEAHKTTGEFNKSFSYALYDHNIKIEKRLFMTATQKVNPYSINTLTMDNELVYGKVAHRLGMREAIEEKIIRDYQIVIVTINKDLINIDKLENPEYKNHLILASLSKAIHEKEIKNGILFQRTIQESKGFVEFANNTEYLSDYRVEHVDGTMKTSERKKHIHQLSDNRPTILSNSRLLSEGIDTPVLDMVGLMHPSKSMVDIIQRLGRVQRKKDSNDKRKGYLFLPLFIGSDVDFSSTDAEDMENWNFIIDILSVIRDVDGKVKGTIDYYKENSVLPNDIIDIVFDDKKVKKEFSEKIISNLIKNIKISYHEELNTNWNNKYNELKAFLDKHGREPKRTKEEIVLGEWCSTQRDKKKSGMLSEERENLLNDISFSWNKFEDAWEENYNNFLDFYKKNKKEPRNAGKGSKIPKKEGDIAKWLGHQKTAYRNGTLKEERFKALEPFVETWDLKSDIIWEEQFDKFKKFLKEENGRFPTDKEGDERWIYRWVNKQKIIHESGKLKEEYMQRLNTLCPDWLLSGKERLWKTQYYKLDAFLKKNKKIPLQNSKNTIEAKAGRWFVSQKKEYASPKLAVWKKEMIDELISTYGLEDEFENIVLGNAYVSVDFEYSGKENWIEAREYEKIACIAEYSASSILKNFKNIKNTSLVYKKVDGVPFVNYQYLLEAKKMYDSITGYLNRMYSDGIDFDDLSKKTRKRKVVLVSFFEKFTSSKEETKNLFVYTRISKMTFDIYTQLINIDI